MLREYLFFGDLLQRDSMSHMDVMIVFEDHWSGYLPRDNWKIPAGYRRLQNPDCEIA
jgi:hypothetical protein